MSLESFERELKDASNWRDAFRMALEGLVNNSFTWSLRYINTLNLPTLEISDTAAYATIKNRKIREGLVVSGLFQVARHRGPGAAEDVEICWDSRYESDRILRAIVTLVDSRESMATPPGGYRGPYEGREAAKVFLRALHTVISEIHRDKGKRFNELHKIAHGREKKYGTPLEEIRISTMGKRPTIEKALRMIMKINKLDENP